LFTETLKSAFEQHFATLQQLQSKRELNQEATHGPHDEKEETHVASHKHEKAQEGVHATKVYDKNAVFNKELVMLLLLNGLKQEAARNRAKAEKKEEEKELERMKRKEDIKTDIIKTEILKDDIIKALISDEFIAALHEELPHVTPQLFQHTVEKELKIDPKNPSKEKVELKEFLRIIHNAVGAHSTPRTGSAKGVNA